MYLFVFIRIIIELNKKTKKYEIDFIAYIQVVERSVRTSRNGD
jgi:hypothetical protein